MAVFFEKLFRLTPTEKRSLGSTLGRIKSVNEFLDDVITAFKGTGLKDAVQGALPWASEITEPILGAVADTVPPVKFIVKLFEGLTKEIDPAKLGLLACTLAYQRAIEKALPEIVGDRKPMQVSEIERPLKKTQNEYDFKSFAFVTALTHPFVKDSDQILKRFANHLGLGEAEFLKLQNEVHIGFLTELRVLLSHGKTRDRFKPFADLMALGSEEERARDALQRHADYQCWLFTQKPILGREPFALRHVYVETDCGQLTWGEIDGARKPANLQRRGHEVLVDPFEEEHGGRQPLIETIMTLIADKDFQDAIVVQGTAGAGKSSMTLRLCYELVNQGLRPIRIELKEIDTSESTPVAEALPAAVRLTDKECDPEASSFYFGKRLFQEDRIFDESVEFQGSKICPYVLILDGWDEINVAASRGYQQQVERMLDAVRQRFLSRRSVPVRVVLTGRPTEAVVKSRFLYEETVVLTVRCLTPDQLQEYMEKLRSALNRKPITLERPDAWTLDRIDQPRKILDRYRKDYSEAGAGRLGVLGLPLLAHLAFRLIAEWPGSSSTQLLEDTTTLYRSLVDMVIEGGKPRIDDSKLVGDATRYPRAHFRGEELRTLLRRTAEAMTALGRESISYDELLVRLGGESDTIDAMVKQLGSEQVLSRLMISFLFRGGFRELGAEFSHKSFREYLVAEGIVEKLKEYGRRDDVGDLAERDIERSFWKDFDKNSDPRYELSRSLGEVLGLRWITPEVKRHLSGLLRWEIARAVGVSSSLTHGSPTQPIDIDGWRSIRDALADLWDWWGEGVHLRSHPFMHRGHLELQWEPPYVVELARSDRPREPRSARDPLPNPTRTVTIDAHLGDGLFHLTTIVHRELLRSEHGHHVSVARAVFGAALRRGRRRYQTMIEDREKRSLIFFAPSGADPYYFTRYISRINAAGYRPLADFPGNATLAGVDLGGVDLRGTDLRKADLRAALLSGSKFGGARLEGTRLGGADLRGADLRGADLSEADLSEADLSDADLSGAHLYRAGLRWVDLSGAVISGADLRWANLEEADLRDADLSGAHLDGANFHGADLSGADMSGAYVAGARLTGEQYESARTRPIPPTT